VQVTLENPRVAHDIPYTQTTSFHLTQRLTNVAGLPPQLIMTPQATTDKPPLPLTVNITPQHMEVDSTNHHTKSPTGFFSRVQAKQQ